MKAIVQDRYGGPEALELAEIDRPPLGDRDALVRMHAASIHFGDQMIMRGKPKLFRPIYGFGKPRSRVPGLDIAGTVEAVGTGVTRFGPGEEVFGTCTGALAEYVGTLEDKLDRKPSNLTFEQAAAVPTSGLAALHGIRDAGKVQPGRKVLINGASGGVGTFAVQIAKALGAEVTGVCSTGNVELVRALGADQVIDYTQEDFTQGGPRYDLILDNAGNHSLSALRRALAPTGRLIPNSGSAGLGTFITAFVSSPFLRQQGRPYLSVPKLKDLTFLKELIEAGKVTPAIDRTYPLSDAADAFRYLENGHARGKVVITS
ncbi:MAG TPA: NAD(P)-dependent alcohol dehydrogenase [Actinomycetota bacterium]|nr:NAD(P)-dependent alcohol dehydrogenase [Actinomycetota bacterium]